METLYVYVSTGCENKMYTLRSLEKIIVSDYYGNRVVYKSYYLKNLSTNLEEAVRKAKEYAENMLIPFSEKEPSKELNQITRKEKQTKEELEKIERKNQEAIAEQERARAEFIKTRIKEAKEMIDNGLVPFGKYRNCRIIALPPMYVKWVMSFNKDDNSPDTSIVEYLKMAILTNHTHLLNWLPHEEKYISGEIGLRCEFVATVINTAHFNSDFGLYTISTLVTKNRECLVVKSTSFNYDVGTTLRFKATIKEFSEYKGQAQTVVTRVTVKVVEKSPTLEW